MLPTRVSQEQRRSDENGFLVMNSEVDVRPVEAVLLREAEWSSAIHLYLRDLLSPVPVSKAVLGDTRTPKVPQDVALEPASPSCPTGAFDGKMPFGLVNHRRPPEFRVCRDEGSTA